MQKKSSNNRNQRNHKKFIEIIKKSIQIIEIREIIKKSEKSSKNWNHKKSRDQYKNDKKMVPFISININSISKGPPFKTGVNPNPFLPNFLQCKGGKFIWLKTFLLMHSFFDFFLSIGNISFLKHKKIWILRLWWRL
jgi:hypothetical protein